MIFFFHRILKFYYGDVPDALLYLLPSSLTTTQGESCSCDQTNGPRHQSKRTLPICIRKHREANSSKSSIWRPDLPAAELKCCCATQKTQFSKGEEQGGKNHSSTPSRLSKQDHSREEGRKQTVSKFGKLPPCPSCTVDGIKLIALQRADHIIPNLRRLQPLMMLQNNNRELTTAPLQLSFLLHSELQF